MSLRTTIIFLLALFAGTAFAQAPAIDSMLIDESKGILSVYGDFGTVQGKVWCDSVELPVLSWSASLITAMIPDTGKGSAGGVEIGVSGYRSEERKISKWVYHSSTEVNSAAGHWIRWETTKYKLSFRYDVESRILSHNFYMPFHSMRYSVDDFQYHDNATPQDPDKGRYDTSFRFTGIIDITKFRVIFDQLCSSEIFHPDTASQMCVAFLDSSFTIPSGIASASRELGLSSLKCVYSGESSFLPSDSLIRWSLSTSTDVKQERAKSISLACYPNPATSELTIVTTEPTRLLLYDVTGKIIKSEQATASETKWDLSLLPNGTYILGTSSGMMQVVQIVK